ncbi:cbb3-type cytochrome c oxidase subunit 3 [Novosphingobium sp.]|uniref:cbb3-type cytochrome c oxidase subunit 3 n=1 Tax=Novosphingobium sp. TaxID=1874826 RepID=UPI0025F4F8B0|nr:cbb3-type cytochrome c oxidase subunit 3 [Novosphingobium sp.]
MTQTETYDLLRQIADSWGLLAMTGVFLVLILWPFRPGARGHYEEAATSIFEEGQDDV